MFVCGVVVWSCVLYIILVYVLFVLKMLLVLRFIVCVVMIRKLVRASFLKYAIMFILFRYLSFVVNCCYFML